MGMIYWMVVSILMQINFGLVFGLMATFACMILFDFLQAFFAGREDLKVKEIKQNNVLVTIEIVEHKGQNMFLVFDALNKKFVLQGMSFDEIKDALKSKYEGKSIFVKNGERSIEPIYIAPTSGLLPK